MIRHLYNVHNLKRIVLYQTFKENDSIIVWYKTFLFVTVTMKQYNKTFNCFNSNVIYNKLTLYWHISCVI